MKSKLLAGVSLAIMGGVSFGATIASAQPTTDVQQEVIVTAQRREQALQDVPLAVSSIGADSLQTRGVSSLADLSFGAVPGVQMSPFAGTPTILGISIRGHGTSDPSQGTTELPVPVYIDGVFLGRGQGLGLDLIEPERVEILRGPQGQLFGRNAEAGLVQYVSRKPSGEFGFKASTSYGNYDAFRTRGSVDFPEFAGFSLQLSGIYNRRDALTDNVPRGRYTAQADYSFLRAEGYRAALRWQPSDTFTADYTYDNSNTRDAQPLASLLPVASFFPPWFGLTPAVPYSDEFPERTPDAIFNEYFVTKARGHSLTLQWDATDALTFKSITSHRFTSRHGSSTLAFHLPAGFSDAGFFYPNAREDLDAKQTSQELQMLGSWERFDLTVGAIYYSEDVRDKRTTILTGRGLMGSFASFSSPATAFLCRGIDPCTIPGNHQGSRTNSYGIYAQGTYTPPILDDRIELTAGVRFSDDTKEAYRDQAFFRLDPAIQSRFSTSRWDPAATLKVKLTDDVNTYVRYATAYRAGGANVRSSNFNAFGAEVLKAIELGLKADLFERRATVNLAVYRNKITGEQLTVQEDPIGNPSLTNTINRSDDNTNYGFEAEVTVRPIENFSIGLNYAHLFGDIDFYILDNPLTPGTVDPTRFYPTNRPRHSGSVLLDYIVPLNDSELRFHTDYSFATNHWATPGAFLASSVPASYVRPHSSNSQLNARVSWSEIPVGSVRGEIALWGKNVLDNADIVYGYDGGALGTGFNAYRVMPRMFGVEFTVKY